MKRPSPALLFLMTFAACCGAVAQATPNAVASNGAPKPVLAVAIDPPKASVSPKDAAIVNVTYIYINVSDHQLVLRWSMLGIGLDIDVRDESGKPAPKTDFGKFYDPSVDDKQKFALQQAHPETFFAADRQDFAAVDAGKTKTWEFAVTRFYDMHQPGKYTIQVQMHDPGNQMLMIKSNTVTVTVTP
jgi:hypothetical protein